MLASAQGQKSGSSSSGSSYIFTGANGSSGAFDMIGDFIEDGSFLVLNKSTSDYDGGDVQLQPEGNFPAAMVQEFDYEGPSSLAVVQSAGGASTTSTQELQVTRNDIEDKFKSAQSSLNNMTVSKNSNAGASDKNMITSSTSSTASSNNLISSPELSLEDVMAQVDRLKSENETLKVSMSEMNVSMKKNLSMFKDWQNTVSSIHEDHQKKYEQSKEIVESLRHENLMLKSQSSSSLLQSQSLMNRNNGGDFVQVDSIETQIEKKDLEIQRLTDQLNEHVALVEEEKLQNHHLKEMIRIQNEERNKCSDEKKKADDEIIQEKDNQIKVLHAALDSSKICIDKFREEHAKKVEEIKILLEEKKILQDEIQKSIMEHNSKTTDQNGSKEKADETQKIINNLKQTVVNLETENNNLKTRNAALSSENEQLEFFRAQLEVYRVDFEAEREGRASMANARDNLQQENIKLKDELEKKTEELEKLHGTHLAMANEHIDRSQVKRIKLDQKNTVGRSSTSAEAVNVEEIGGLFRNDSNRNPAGTSSTSTNEESQARNSSEERSSTREISPCPLCQKKFTTLQSLADHASNCGLEQESIASRFVFP